MLPSIHIVSTRLYSVICSSHHVHDKEEEEEEEEEVENIPNENNEYKLESYWNSRFEKEKTHDWLGNLEDFRLALEKGGVEFSSSSLKRNDSVLVVGCGNSSLSRDLATLLQQSITSIDFSNVVIDTMKRKHPELNWIVMDMTNMTFPDETFDLVLDKAACDALVTDEGDPWDPSDSCKASVDSMMQSVERVLRPGGTFAMISFQQPIFRTKHLRRSVSPDSDSKQGCWNPNIKVIPVEKLGMEYFVYVLNKKPTN